MCSRRAGAMASANEGRTIGGRGGCSSAHARASQRAACGTEPIAEQRRVVRAPCGRRPPRLATRERPPPRAVGQPSVVGDVDVAQIVVRYVEQVLDRASSRTSTKYSMVTPMRSQRVFRKIGRCGERRASLRMAVSQSTQAHRRTYASRGRSDRRALPRTTKDRNRLALAVLRSSELEDAVARSATNRTDDSRGLLTRREISVDVSRRAAHSQRPYGT